MARRAVPAAGIAVASVLAVLACTTRTVRTVPSPAYPGTSPVPRPASPAPPLPAPAGTRTSRTDYGAVGSRLIRVALRSTAGTLHLSSRGDWRLYDADGGLLARAEGGESWAIESDGSRERAIRPDGVPTVWSDGPIVARADDPDGAIVYGGRHYRGDIIVYAGGDRGFVVVDRLEIDDYIAGVVAEEIGRRPPSDSAAVQAQAIAARSYAAIHLGDGARYDVTSGTNDQVYGGADAEDPVASAAVASTRGLVLMYAGRIVNAPYHSTCGGATAEADEVWRTEGEPYLRSVSDRIPGTDRYYCDISPRFRWTRTIDRATLNAALARYLKSYAAGPAGRPGAARSVAVEGHTVSGRVARLRIGTDRGTYVLRGNDIRYVLRAPGGEILNSTYFSVEAVTGSDGSIDRLTLRGRGNGHGVGMCQWGAIGRARAGQDFRTILAAYYPGTTVGTID